jgi:protein O-GlcNAc transferase
LLQAIRLKPDDAEALDNLGRTLLTLGRPAEAVEFFSRAVALQPASPQLHNNLGSALNELRRHAEAEASYRRALELEPASPEVLNNLGIALTDLYRFAEAARLLQTALRIKPDYAEAHSSLGNVCMALRRFEDAVASYRRAIELRPDSVDAQHNLATALRRLGHHEEAAEAYRRERQLDAGNASTLVELTMLERQLCDWQSTESREAEIIDRVRSGAAVSPMSFLCFSTSSADQLRCAQNYFAQNGLPDAGPRAAPERAPDGKIRIAYLSFDFREHATAYLLAELLERHDRSKFDVVAVSFGPDDESPMRRRIVAAVDRFVDIRQCSDAAAARLIAEMSVDIAVDLNGLTGDNRCNILARRPAPVQVNYLGYPGTMGAPFIDYVIVDPYVVPPAEQRFFSERLVYLPDCYQVNDTRRAIAEQTPSRAECALPERGLVFACFNNNYKITPVLFDVWCRLLRAVPDSVLWLLQDNSSAAANLRREAQARGVSPDRLVFAPRMKLPEHLARHRLADLFLDTLPVNAHTTASDALWAGLPVITCAGGTFVSRVAGSLLRAVGLSELVTRELADYENLALKLAAEPSVLADVRARLARNLPVAPLFDLERYRTFIEAAYQQMADRHRRGEQPISFSATPAGENAGL